MENTTNSVANRSASGKKIKHRVSNDLKQQILKRIKEEGVSVNQAAEDHGLNPKTIYNWLAKGVNSAPNWHEVAKLKKEKQMLLELVGEITVKLSQSQKKS